MTNRQVRYFSRKTQARRVRQLVSEVQGHPHRSELVQLIAEQVHEDTSRSFSQVFFT